jgi:hypothetical protein
MTYIEWVAEFNKSSKGGEVPNPFPKTGKDQTLDDQLPKHLLPKPETFAVIEGGKKNTPDSTEDSTKNLKNSSESGKGQTSTTNGESETSSLVQQSLTSSQKTNRKRLTAKQLQAQERSTQSVNAVSFRSVAGMAYVTDEISGNEYSEQQLEENTKGVCAFCDEPIGDMTEIAKFFGKNKFICTHCTEPSSALRIVA